MGLRIQWLCMGPECWPATTKHEQALQILLRWAEAGTQQSSHTGADDKHLMWYGHVCGKNCPPIRSRGRPKKLWMDLEAKRLNPEDAIDKRKWPYTTAGKKRHLKMGRLR